MRAQKQSLPGWLPFAILASGFVAIAAGIKSNWTLAADQPKPPPQPPPVPPISQAGVLHDWATGDFRI